MQASIRRVFFNLLIAGGLFVAFAAHRLFSPGQSLRPVAAAVSSLARAAKAGGIVVTSPVSPKTDGASFETRVDEALAENVSTPNTQPPLPTLVLAWADTDFPSFSEYLHAHPERASLLVEALASAAASSRLTPALSDLLARFTPSQQDNFAMVAVRTLASKDPQTAADWVALPAVFPASALAVEYVAGELASRDPKLLDNWLAGLPAHLNSASAYAGAYRQLAADSPDRAMDALITLAEKPGVDPDHVSAATRGVIEMIATDEPDLAAELSRRLTNTRDRALALQHSLVHQDKSGDVQLP